MMTPISYRYTPSPSSIHTPMLFFTFLRLPLCSRNNKYSIHHLFLLNSSPFKKAQIAFHHCTFSFITAHSVHHCTLKQALQCPAYTNVRVFCRVGSWSGRNLRAWKDSSVICET